MPQATILLIDDDETLLELLSSHLQAAGYRPLAAPDGASGLRLAAEAKPDLVVLDVMMPGMDGWQVCERLRGGRDAPAGRLDVPPGRQDVPPARQDVPPGRQDVPPERLYHNVPIILLTAKGEEIDKLRGFHLGVDDYVTKPFSFAELVARVRALLARAALSPVPAHRLTRGDLALDLDERRVTVAGRPVDLTPTEYRLLETLARNADRTVPTETLLAEVWGPEYVGEAEHVKHFIWTLRKKIEADPGDPKRIMTERGFGYRFE